MYDTIHFRLPYIRGEENHLLSFYDITRNTERNGVSWFRLNVENLQVTIYTSTIWIKGSLVKYHLGDNLQSLTCDTTRLAIEELSDTLHLEMDKAMVQRIDVAANLPMTSFANTYFPVLGEHPDLSRVRKSNTSLAYEQKCKQQSHYLLFYDKTEEMDKRMGQILRYEDRWMGDLQKQLNYPEIEGKTLYDKDFYMNVISLWKDDYLKIQKVRTPLLRLEAPLSKASEAKNAMCYLALRNMPIESLIEAREYIKANIPDKQNAYRFEKSIKELCKTKYFQESSSTFDSELNEAIIERFKQEMAISL